LTHVIAVDLVASLLAIAGFLLAFRQHALRSGWIGLRLHRGRRPLPSSLGEEGRDAAHYAMIISGTMMMAFGIILFAFTTIYAAFA
jgi:hypothetical protein